MKDLAHHMKKLNRRIIRSAHREEMEEDAWDLTSPYIRKQTPGQVKKQAKAKISKTRKARPATPLTPDQKNRKMKNRVPIFDRQNNAKPKQGARKSSKKTPRI